VNNAARGPSDGGRLSFEFTFNGRPVTAHGGDTIASALVRSGVYVFSRSMKFHRPRGLYCGASRCYACAMRVNGIPGVRTCATRAESGMVVETEGGFPTTNTDILSVLDHVFRREFDYQARFIRPRFMVPVYQRIVRRLASSRHLPDKSRSFSPLESVRTDVLIVGHGASGTIATDKLRGLGINPIIADRHGTDVFPPAIAFGFYEDGRVGLMTETGGMLVRAKAVLLATGRVEAGMDVPNGDLPGVMLPEAVEHLVTRGVRPGKRAFIIGKSELRDEILRNLGTARCEVVGESEDPKMIVRIIGRKRVNAVEVLGVDGNRERRECDLVVLLGPMVPYVSLAQQAGCEMRICGEFWCVKADEDCRTSVPNVFSCGSVAGKLSDKERSTSGERAAAAIAHYLGVR
jgi:sarcosine oxidase subunit alpha